MFTSLSMGLAGLAAAALSVATMPYHIIIIMKTYYAPVSIKKMLMAQRHPSDTTMQINIRNYYDTTRQLWKIKYYCVRPTSMWRTQTINQYVK